ncbi:hypothetical protein GQF56_05395 [Rhodobacter sphaeroides]|jgi:hypothetical protein|uniref:Uncharacterized protein n=1 Tax=Cereibacter sphaeroides (strain ATCC 17023 / DSM 158 / JCM 6121 / CCUG 31486 / LMG 2827 / NBRC 12203 / NCIMB 8253 / ATH 2.4.1.) TaxID=272943 RepID=U5NRI8_CERS4|nr:hypothetical protein RSP_7555 [Cereibacter sphaeroides 2.4.1]AZB54902.1 hypothetical protein EBL89_06070 [Cereibacter sphaeroides]AXC61730.1 hypothetical protein DQL45_10250 [Cereibacter sphaeroides 2.4.1]AZB59153.1 hypothetical protein EBL88_06005 [Cereibacter sphaeroides]MVX47308.1 hypothetical protein [Cereibacter sphaeroides]
MRGAVDMILHILRGRGLPPVGRPFDIQGDTRR